MEEFNGRDLFFHTGDNTYFKAFVMGELATKDAFVFFVNTEGGLAIADELSDFIFPGEGEHPMEEWIEEHSDDEEEWFDPFLFEEE